MHEGCIPCGKCSGCCRFPPYTDVSFFPSFLPRISLNYSLHVFFSYSCARLSAFPPCGRVIAVVTVAAFPPLLDTTSLVRFDVSSCVQQSPLHHLLSLPRASHCCGVMGLSFSDVLFPCRRTYYFSPQNKLVVVVHSDDIPPHDIPFCCAYPLPMSLSLVVVDYIVLCQHFRARKVCCCYRCSFFVVSPPRLS